MGAFLLVREGSEDFDVGGALEIIGRQCGTRPELFSCGSYRIWLFPKRLVAKASYKVAEGCSVFITGSPWAPGCASAETIEVIHSHFNKGSASPPPVRGHYCSIAYCNDKIIIAKDRNSLYPVYRNATGDALSSSFLGLCTGLPSLTLSVEAMTENLLTGAIIGNETIFKEISLIGHADRVQQPNLSVAVHEVQPVSGNYRNRKAAIDAQIDVLDEYFSGMKSLVAELGVDAGITGGYDSRLLLAFCLRHFPHEKMSLHSHLRKTPGTDYDIAFLLASVAGMPLTGIPVDDISEMASEDVAGAMDEGMLFSDGQIRSNLFWFEDFTTARYRIAILAGRRLGLNGIGGEMYRNMEGFAGMPVSLRSFIRFDLITRIGGVRTLERTDFERLVTSIEKKIFSWPGGLPFSRQLTLFDVKRYLAEIYNPAGRAIRIACENRISWFISPFADFQPVAAALRASDKLGMSMDFEAEIIRRINKPLAEVKSGYGYSLTINEPPPAVLKRVLFRNLVPAKLQPLLYENFIRKGITPRWSDLRQQSEWLEKCFIKVEESGLPADALAERTDIGPLVYAMGHLLNRFSHKIIR